MGETGLHDTEGQRVDTGLAAHPPCCQDPRTGGRFQTPRLKLALGQSHERPKCRLARLIHLRPEPPGTVPARNAGPPNKPCSGCHWGRGLSTHRDHQPDAETPCLMLTSLSWLVPPQHKQARAPQVPVCPSLWTPLSGF